MGIVKDAGNAKWKVKIVKKNRCWKKVLCKGGVLVYGDKKKMLNLL